MSERKEIVIHRATVENMPAILKLITDVFEGEQRIPAELIPIPETMQPQWWCAETDRRLIGSVALYREGEERHMGRFAIVPEDRGGGLGTRLIRFAIEDVFSEGIDCIYVEARDTTVHILQKLGGEVTGEAVPFYEGTVTPMILRKSAYNRYREF